MELDIEVVGAVAPGARMAVYFAQNTDQGFLDAVTTAVHDTTNQPSIISISWGGPESSWSGQSLTAYDEAFQAAAAMGVTVCVAAGDNGSGDGVTSDKLAHVDFPASSPEVLACGGTALAGAGATISCEVVWNAGDWRDRRGHQRHASPFPPTRRAQGSRSRPTPGAGSGGGYRTWRATPTRTPATRSWSTARARQ